MDRHFGLAAAYLRLVRRQNDASMTAGELNNIGTVAGLIVSAGVAALVFPLWRRHRHWFLLVFGFSGLFDIFTLLVSVVVESLPDSEYASASKVVQVLQIIGMVIYGAGLLLLARFVRAITIGTPPSDADAAPTV